MCCISSACTMNEAPLTSLVHNTINRWECLSPKCFHTACNTQQAQVRIHSNYESYLNSLRNNHNILFVINALPLIKAPSTIFITKSTIFHQTCCISHLNTHLFHSQIFIWNAILMLFSLKKYCFTLKNQIFLTQFTCDKRPLLKTLHTPGTFITVWYFQFWERTILPPPHQD